MQERGPVSGENDALGVGLCLEGAQRATLHPALFRVGVAPSPAAGFLIFSRSLKGHDVAPCRDAEYAEREIGACGVGEVLSTSRRKRWISSKLKPIPTWPAMGTCVVVVSSPPKP